MVTSSTKPKEHWGGFININSEKGGWENFILKYWNDNFRSYIYGSFKTIELWNIDDW